MTGDTVHPPPVDYCSCGRPPAVRRRPLYFADDVYLLFFSAPNLRGRSVDRRQTLTRVRLSPDF